METFKKISCDRKDKQGRTIPNKLSSGRSKYGSKSIGERTGVTVMYVRNLNCSIISSSELEVTECSSLEFSNVELKVPTLTLNSE